ncbi:MAG: E3 binding domain-containing protein, partial [Candidatus Aenigmatarchaeota archaeon]
MLEFEFPDTGEGVTEGQFLEWQIEEGDEIEEDQVVAEVETDKAVVDIPAPTKGVVKQLKASPGDKIKVGDVIMIIEDGARSRGTSEESEDTSGTEEVEADGSPESQDEENEVEIEDPVENSKDNSQENIDGEVLALPKVRKLAEEKGVDLASIKTGERITEDEVLEADGSKKHSKTKSKETGKDAESKPEKPEEKETVNTSGANASPSVRKLAREKGVDLSGIEGSGRGGTLTRKDVLNAAGANKKTSAGKHTVSSEGGEERVELSGVEKNIADKMTKSRFTAPHVTHVDKADVTELVELRNEKKDKVDTHLTYLPFIVKAVMLAMKNYPELN